jgi:hypothetical protein
MSEPRSNDSTRASPSRRATGAFATAVLLLLACDKGKSSVQPATTTVQQLPTSAPSASSAPAVAKIKTTCADWGGTQGTYGCELSGPSPLTVTFTGRFKEKALLLQDDGKPLFSVTNAFDHDLGWIALKISYRNSDGTVGFEGEETDYFLSDVDMSRELARVGATRELAVGMSKGASKAATGTPDVSVAGWGWDADDAGPKMSFRLAAH